MTWLLRIAAVAMATFALSTGASAGLIDFANHANTVGEHGVQDGDSEVVDGFSITFYATAPGADGYAYFDEWYGTPETNAGLGVCGTLTFDDYCTISGDDNLTSGETLTLVFDFVIELSGLIFKDELHNPIDPTETLMINGTEYTFAAASAATFIGDTFVFAYGGSNPDQYYISAANAERYRVPGPAALSLIGFGLAGLAIARRRRA